MEIGMGGEQTHLCLSTTSSFASCLLSLLQVPVQKSATRSSRDLGTVEAGPTIFADIGQE